MHQPTGERKADIEEHSNCSRAGGRIIRFGITSSELKETVVIIPVTLRFSSLHTHALYCRESEDALTVTYRALNDESCPFQDLRLVSDPRRHAEAP
jgi:hypothetical protein